MERKELVQVSFRVPRVLRDLVKRYLVMDLHMNESEFFRDALREKIRRDAPELYRSLFTEEQEVPTEEEKEKKP